MKPALYLKACLFGLLLWTTGCGGDDSAPASGETLTLERITIGEQSGLNAFENVMPDAVIELEFSTALDASTLEDNLFLRRDGSKVAATLEYDGAKNVTLTPQTSLTSYAEYQLVVNTGLATPSGRKIISGKVVPITTGFDDSDKFDRIPDEELLTLVQRQTFRYFWEGAEQTSGMARERTSSGTTVTTGGTGFGVMAMTVAAERGFITRDEACERVQRIVTFLSEKATSYHGAFSHWINGETGATIPFSTDDNGADLVETALLFQGLLTARAYFDGTGAEQTLRDGITRLWEAVEWNFFTKEGSENALYWHWSPDKGWAMNMPVQGWNEALIVYVLAAASPTHPIDREVYNAGWARNGAIRNGKLFYDTTLPLGDDYGGPLFLAHYSFLGLDPNRLSDQYADYREQVTAHATINYKYCVDNPKGHSGYSADCWGLTSSDIDDGGYAASSPTNDLGVIAPTAALASMPYLPEESMAALHYFYYKLGDKLWSDYGFIDAFNLSTNWFDKGMHIAIDQGPIVVMIENHRSGLPWKLFMSDAEILSGLQRLGFTVGSGSN